jgi:hypothetical protein
MRDSSASEAKGRGRVGRDVDNAIADERTAIDDDDGDAAPIAEVGDIKMRAERQRAVSADQAAKSWVMVIGGLADPPGLRLRNHKKKS